MKALEVEGVQHKWKKVGGTRSIHYPLENYILQKVSSDYNPIILEVGEDGDDNMKNQQVENFRMLNKND